MKFVRLAGALVALALTVGGALAASSNPPVAYGVPKGAAQLDLGSNVQLLNLGNGPFVPGNSFFDFGTAKPYYRLNSTQQFNDATGAAAVAAWDFSIPGIPATVATARASVGAYYDASLNVQSAAANTARLTYDHLTSKFSGLLVEDTSSNGVPNTTWAGAVVGVVGSGGQNPTGMGPRVAVSGVNVQIVSLGTENGLSTIAIRFFGQASAQADFIYEFQAANSYTVAAADVQTCSFRARQSDSTNTAGVVRTLATIDQYTSGLSFVSFAGTRIMSFPLDVTTPLYTTQTMSGTTARAVCAFDLLVAANTAFDVTYVFAQPQIEKRSAPTSAIAGGTTRNADAVAVPSLFSIPASAHTIAVTARAPRDPISSTGIVTPLAGVAFQIDDGTESNRETIRRHTDGHAYCTVVSASTTVADLDLGVWQSGTPLNIACSVGGGTIAGAAGGRTAVTASASGPSGLVNGRIGNNSGLTSAWNSIIGSARVYASAAGTANAPAWSKTPWLYDDIQRADGAIGSPPGALFAYGQVPANASNDRLMAIVSHQFVTPDSGGFGAASYTGIDLTVQPSRMAGSFTFQNDGTAGGRVVFITNQECLTAATSSAAVLCITDSSNHIVVNDSSVSLQWFLNNVATTLTQIFYPAALTRDGTTVYQAEVNYDYRRCIVSVRGPDGGWVQAQSIQVCQRGGRYTQIESFWTNGQNSTRISSFISQQ